MFKLGDVVKVWVMRPDGLWQQRNLEVTHFTASKKLVLKDAQGDLSMLSEEVVTCNSGDTPCFSKPIQEATNERDKDDEAGD